jgi:hypothetical protein
MLVTSSASSMYLSQAKTKEGKKLAKEDLYKGRRSWLGVMREVGFWASKEIQPL